MRGTKVTPAGVEAFHKALPNCRMETDFGTAEARDMATTELEERPDYAHERAVAQWLLSIGGLGRWADAETGQEGPLDANHPLLATSVVLKDVNLSNNQQVNDEDSARLSACKCLEFLEIVRSPIKGAGLKYVVPVKSLRRRIWHSQRLETTKCLPWPR